MLKRLLCHITSHQPRLLGAFGVCNSSGATITYRFRCQRCGAYTEISEARDRYGDVDEVGTWFEEARR